MGDAPSLRDQHLANNDEDNNKYNHELITYRFTSLVKIILVLMNANIFNLY